MRPEDIPCGDVLIHAGDFTMTGTVAETRRFVNFIAKLPHKHKIVVAGNHDVTLDAMFYAGLSDSEVKRRYGHDPREDDVTARALLNGPEAPCTYLHNSSVKVSGGLTVWGSPVSPAYGWWAFQRKPGDDIRQVWRQCPAGVDVVISHGPARGHGDRVWRGGDGVGCEALREEVLRRIRPKVVVCGHIHEDAGVTSEDGVIFVNAATCNLGYQPTQEAVVFDIHANGTVDIVQGKVRRTERRREQQHLFGGAVAV